MNTPRTERARYLGEQLAAVMNTLGTTTRGPDVVVFLDLLARIEAYAPEDLPPELPALVAEAQAARAEHADELARVASRAFDLDQLLHAGRHLPDDDLDGDRDAWLRDVLRLATVAPWLTPARRRQAAWALEKAHAMIEAEADAFLDASVLVSDRRNLEAPERLGEEARAYLTMLGDLPLLVAFDRVPAQADAARVARALRNVPAALIDVVDDARADHHARANLRLPAAAALHALAAADTSEIILVRMEAGAWVLAMHRGALTLRFEPDTTALAPQATGDTCAVDMLDGAMPGPVPVDAQGAFPLPPTQAGLRLRLRVGPDSRVVTLPPAGA